MTISGYVERCDKDIRSAVQPGCNVYRLLQQPDGEQIGTIELLSVAYHRESAAGASSGYRFRAKAIVNGVIYRGDTTGFGQRFDGVIKIERENSV